VSVPASSVDLSTTDLPAEFEGQAAVAGAPRPAGGRWWREREGILWRRGLAAYFRPVSAGESGALEALASGQTFGASFDSCSLCRYANGEMKSKYQSPFFIVAPSLSRCSSSHSWSRLRRRSLGERPLQVHPRAAPGPVVAASATSAPRGSGMRSRAAT